MAFSKTFDTATPGGGSSPTEADDRMREIKAATQERMDVDHFWPLSGTTVDNADTGEHKKVTLRTGSAPTQAADKGIIYAKDVGGKAELFYRDEDGNEIQLTSGGKLGAATQDSRVNNGTVAGTLGVTGVLTTTAAAVLGDGSVLAAATEAGDGDRVIADKAYIDNQISALISVVSDTQVGQNKPSVTLTLTAGTWHVEVTVFASGGSITRDRNIMIAGDVSGTFEGTGNQSGDVTGFGVGYKQLTTVGGDVICTVSGTLTDTLLRNSVLAAKAIRIGN